MKKLSTRDFVLLALLVAVQIVLGYVNIPMPGGLHRRILHDVGKLLLRP